MFLQMAKKSKQKGVVKRKKFTKEERQKIFERDNYTCQNKKCNKNLFFLPRERVLDHKIPLSKGGNNSIENMWLLCDECDKVKKNRVIPELAKEYVNQRIAYLESQAIKKRRNIKKDEQEEKPPHHKGC